MESEWENFEKMLAGGDDEISGADANSSLGNPPTIDNPDTTKTEVPLPAVSNPYSYLSVYTDQQTHGNYGLTIYFYISVIRRAQDFM